MSDIDERVDWSSHEEFLSFATTISFEDNSLLWQIGEKVCCNLELVVADQACEIAEIEFYVTTKKHPDPFTHCHDLQKEFGKWYLHRVGSGIRNGSFKGIDFTIGDGANYAAVLLRTLRRADGSLVSGPSLCVDYLIKTCGVRDVHKLNESLSQLSIFAPQSVVHLRQRETAGDSLVFRTARVGLSTKTESKYSSFRYRFLTEPRGIKKGRRELIEAMLMDKFLPEQIREITGSPLKKIRAIESSIH